MARLRFICSLNLADFSDRLLAANRQRPRDIPAHWIIKGDDKQFLASVAQYASESKADSEVKARVRREVVKMPSRCCIGLFAAADALGLGFVRGVPPHLYLEHLDLDVPTADGAID